MPPGSLTRLALLIALLSLASPALADPPRSAPDDAASPLAQTDADHALGADPDEEDDQDVDRALSGAQSAGLPETPDDDDDGDDDDDDDDSLLSPGVEIERLRDEPPRVAVAEFRPGSGVYLLSEGGGFALQIGLRGQLLFTALDVPDAELVQGLELRRGRLNFSGHTFSEHIRYRIQLHFSPRDMRFDETDAERLTPLRDFILSFDYWRDLTLQLGQYKVPFSRQRVISSGKLQFVDRSIVSREFTVDRDIGFDLRSEDLFGLGLMRYYAGVYRGEGTGAYAFTEPNYMYVARVEVLPLGLFDDYTEGVPADFDGVGLSLGLGFAHVQAAPGNAGIIGPPPADGGTSDTTHLATGAIFKAYDFSLSGEYMARWSERNPGDARTVAGIPIPTELPREGHGFYVQSGLRLPFLLPHDVEVAARYGALMPFSAAESSLDARSELGAALSWYIYQHSLKLQTDYFRFWGDEGIRQGVDQYRLQLQVSL